MAKKLNKKTKKQFSKKLAVWILILDVLSIILTFVLCFISVFLDYQGELTYLVTTITALQFATGFVLASYFKKSAMENTCGGIVYETALKQYENEGANNNG